MRSLTERTVATDVRPVRKPRRLTKKKMLAGSKDVADFPNGDRPLVVSWRLFAIILSALGVWAVWGSSAMISQGTRLAVLESERRMDSAKLDDIEQKLDRIWQKLAGMGDS